ncbi:NTD biosynthesis operon regulator NtdR [Bacillus cereus]|uniref:LacI family DNA-binding transcriptional regulator n=1 Tax=Bacillus TaxID=1386 RepID=UPI000BEE537A|nr:MULTISPECIES: LacI family DNA-binding transcriptional regulator [Bacillus cereus group]WIK99091.1 LacI family DNA-binding transcriptional regulator [Bacillus bombysepticus]MEB8944781.1 LacI family DNA-binding transcriptional regulator [Bacillus cereus]MEB9945288.1 LacI family DNA-binding transcriptional regulator [Bacillus cereus]MEE3959877.1 LacI family DNA-binding transcriptional regulator [Bacillus thuringiensis]NIL29541.1 LacI family DNA-binding transcriptional regulator [Bacillus thuri
MVTINEIAKLCNVSNATVSRVLNNHPYVNPEKREKIIQIMKELNYTPSSIARNLRVNKTQTIALSIPNIDHPFFGKLAREISKELLKHNYKLLIYQTFYEKKIELELLSLLKNRAVDGVILASLENDWENIEHYLAYGPILLCNEYEENAPIPIICYDEFEAGYKAVKHLISKGHKKIGFCFDSLNSQAQLKRKQGYLHALKEQQLSYKKSWLFGDAITIKDGIRIFERLDKLKNRPTALFTGNDQVAAGVIKGASLKGYTIPTDLAVCGYDNQLICTVTTPTISTIDIPIVELSKRTVSEILLYINEKESIKRKIIEYPATLIIREST